MTETTDTKAGFVAILGAPNAGKSTLLNRLVGQKVSIISPKVQTTRSRILGICSVGLAQVVLVDTPGIFIPRNRLGRAMVSCAWNEAENADMILILVDAKRKTVTQDTQSIIDAVREKKQPVIFVLNKIDLVEKSGLLALMESLAETGISRDIFTISATKGDGIDQLVNHIAAALPVGPWLFPPDQITDMPARLLAAEITREKLYYHVHQEVPYATMIETEDWQPKKDGSLVIRQIIYVQNASQKGIMLGRGGQRLKKIGLSTRYELESLLNCKVHLFLFVKVRENWQDDSGYYKQWQLNPKA